MMESPLLKRQKPKKRKHINRAYLVGVFSIFSISILVINQVLALNDIVKLWTFSTANAAQFNYSPSVINIDNGATPLANKFTNAHFDTNLDGWVSEPDVPEGWVVVPGDPATYGTEDFLVMKYEAKAWDTQTGSFVATGGATSSVNWAGADTQTRYRAVSIPEGRPWTNIARSGSSFDAIEACSAIGPSYHLINNMEWMTIARNAENQPVNWSLGEVGSGYLYAGHNDNSPAISVYASSNDNYRAAFTDSIGSIEALLDPTHIEAGTASNVGYQVRVLELSNGSKVWDLAGNTNSWVNQIVGRNDQPDAGAQGLAYREYPEYTTSWGSLGLNAYRPSNPTFNSVQGIGMIYAETNSYYSTARSFRRGGSWGEVANFTGLYALTLHMSGAESNTTTGFRCASGPIDINETYLQSSGLQTGGYEVDVGPNFDAKVSQSVNVGDTGQYELSVAVKDITLGDEGYLIQDDSVVQLLHNGVGIATNYEPLGDGWYRLSATVTGANADVDYGILVKKGYTVIADNFRLVNPDQTYSLYMNEAYSNNQVASWDTLCEGTLSGDTCTIDSVKPTGSEIRYQLCNDDGATCESGNLWKYWDGDSWETAIDGTTSNTASELTQAVMSTFDTSTKKINAKIFLVPSEYGDPTLNSLSIGLTPDATPPGNISEIQMKKTASSIDYISPNDWTNSNAPYFEWDDAEDNEGGSGTLGYCMYISLGDTNPNLQTATSPYLPGNTNLNSTHISSAETECGNGSGFLVAQGDEINSIDFSNVNYRGSQWLESSLTPYYLYISAVDGAGNISDELPVSFHFRLDNTPPINVSYLSCASANFASVADMNFSWPVIGTAASSDPSPGTGLLGWQYQINSTTGTWLGTGEHVNTELGIGNYIPIGETSRILTEEQDGAAIDIGENIVYFRTVDQNGNFSTDATIRTCNLSFGGEAPDFGGSDVVTIDPAVSESNYFSLSWPEAFPAVEGRTIQKYYYMVGDLPPSTLTTLQNNPTRYIDNGMSRTVSARALTNVNSGTNTVYVVAIDSENTYSPSNFIQGTFTLNSNDPDNVRTLTASDSSIKSETRWMVTLSWVAPDYQGAGNLTYLIQRSSDGVSFAEVGTTSGLSYVDSTPESTQYYYKVITKDGANAQSSGTNAVSVTPTGKWAVPADLEDEPKAVNIATKKATIQWSTSRASDTKVAYGTESNNYKPAELGNSEQKAFHSIDLIGLEPSTIYYYRAKWTDEDGNTGISDEQTFQTAPAPYATDVSVTGLNLNSATVRFKTVGASTAKIYFGQSIAFGGLNEIPTSTSQAVYLSQIDGLLDGTRYFYRINVLDQDGAEYPGTVLDFTTPPRPRISNIRLQQVADTAESTILVSWDTNTEVSSIIRYYPSDEPGNIREAVNTEYLGGEQTMQISGLLPSTNYVLVVTGRDAFGNESSSDQQRFTTATDTRPPKISNLNVETMITPNAVANESETPAQIIVTWRTDEPATSQVEFGEGTGTFYSQKTQQDGNLVLNHTVIVQNLSAAKVYHVRAVSLDEVGNIGNSIDVATITPKATENILELVLRSLMQLFNFQI